jgi:hypothetical protein
VIIIELIQVRRTSTEEQDGGVLGVAGKCLWLQISAQSTHGSLIDVILSGVPTCLMIL